MTMRIETDTTNGGSQPVPSPWTKAGGNAKTPLNRVAMVDSNNKTWEKYDGDHKLPYNRTKESKRHSREKSIVDPNREPRKRSARITYRHYTAILYLILYAVTVIMDTDANMSDAVATSKRQKRNEGEQSPTTKQTRFTEPDPDETVVSTKIQVNRHLENPFLETLPESLQIKAKTPYETLFGEDSCNTRLIALDYILYSYCTGNPFAHTAL
jgi:hypothetical protein